MADTKITALAAITTVDPAADVFPIVDVSDTSMAASGTTKKITSNQILGAGGTATLASATITGDLTVDTSTLKVDSTNNRVGVVQATPLYPLDVTGIVDGTAVAARLAYGVGGSVYSAFRFENTSFSGGNSEIRNYVNGATGTGSDLAFFTTQTGGSTLTERYRFDINGVHTWSNVGGVAGTAMTLNSTGLGVGVTPSAGKGALQLSSGINFPATQVASTDPNTLDDYEEGTWTGTLKGGTTDPTIPVTATGEYTKIGNQVFVRILFANVTTTGASGAISVTGIPFANGSNRTIGSCLCDLIATFTGSPICWIGGTGTTLNFQASNSNAASSDLTHNAGSGRYFYASITYTV